MMENIRLKEEKNKIEHDKIMKSHEETMKQNAIIHEKNMKNLQVHYDNEMNKQNTIEKMIRNARVEETSSTSRKSQTLNRIENMPIHIMNNINIINNNLVENNNNFNNEIDDGIITSSNNSCLNNTEKNREHKYISPKNTIESKE